MKNLKEMNKHEKIAYMSIKAMFQYETGTWVNCIYDNDLDYIPNTIEDAKKEIKELSLVDCAGYGKYDGSYRCGGAPKEMRFAGNEFIDSVIDYLFEEDSDGDITEIGLEKGWFHEAEEPETEAKEKVENSKKLNTLKEEIERTGNTEIIKVISKCGLVTFEGEAYRLFAGHCKTLLNTTVKKVEGNIFYLNRKYLPIKVK